MRQMFHVRNVLPITPDRLVNRLDHVPATDYIWLFIVYDSSLPENQCKCKFLILLLFLSNVFFKF